MSDLKKRFLIILIPILLLIILVICLTLFKKELKEPDPLDSLISTDIFNQDVNIIVDKGNKSEIENIEVENNKNDYTVNNEQITIDTGDNLILSSSSVKINDDYSILELLIGLTGNKGYMNDAQLSTSYDFAMSYSKKWLLIDNKTNEQYFILQNKGYDLLLNTKLKDDNIEVDYMYVIGDKTYADHLFIPLDDIIDNAIAGNEINYKNYSIYNNNEISDFNPSNYVTTTETSLDLDGDGKDDIIKIDFHSGNKAKDNGISIKINDISKDFIFYDICQTVRIIDLDKSDKYKELLFTCNENIDGSYSTLIVSFDGKNIIRTFKSNNRIEEFQLKTTQNNFEEFEIKTENGLLPITYHTVDGIQRWKLKAYLDLNDNHKLVLSKGDKNYYESYIVRNSSAVIDVILYSDMDYNSEKIEVKSGENMKFIGTTLDYWGVIEYNEKTYYLPIDNTGKIYGSHTYVSEIFNGLAIYD